MKKVQNITESTVNAPSLEEQMMQQKAIAYDILAEQQRLEGLMRQVNANIASIGESIQKRDSENTDVSS